MKNFIDKINIYSLIGIVFVFVIWFTFGNIINNDIILPKPNDVLSQLWVLLSKNSTYIIIFNTIVNLLITVIISLVLSIILSLLSLTSRAFNGFISVIVSIIKTLPIATIIVIILIMFGGAKSPLIITGFVVFPLQYEAIYTSFKSVDKNLIDDLKTLTSLNFTVLKDVLIPINLPFILSAIIASFGLGFKVMVMAEFITQPKNTIGMQLLYNKDMLEMTSVFAWTVLIVVLVIIFDVLVKKVKTFQD
ncbi:MAG: ABC transporter permease subunit [Bacilli bacterium]